MSASAGFVVGLAHGGELVLVGDGADACEHLDVRQQRDEAVRARSCSPSRARRARRRARRPASPARAARSSASRRTGASAR